ncbi:MAG: hypothetical protein KDD00_10760 [Ignavibacteriae bacterium]|nr:hypothetical protein [Ignavibacteriota bacterium]
MLDKSRKIFQGCYTSVINASEVFSRCSDEQQLSAAKDTFNDIGILGIPFRYSLKIAEIMKAVKKKSPETHTGMCLS